MGKEKGVCEDPFATFFATLFLPVRRRGAAAAAAEEATRTPIIDDSDTEYDPLHSAVPHR